MTLTFSDSTSRGLFIFSIVMGIVCSLATTLRFVSTIRSNRKVSLDDWFALGALLSYLVYISLDLTSISLVSGKDLDTLSSDELTRLGKILFATIPFYPLNQCFAKFSILYLYYRLFSVNKVFVRWTYIIGASQITISILTLFINLFSCIPVSYSWDFDEDGWCLDQAAVFAGTESVNSAVDLAMLVLSCFIVHELRLKMSTKLKLGVIFLVGSLSGVIGIVRIVEFYLQASEDEVGVFSATQGFWESSQMAACIICCCAPIYKNIFPLGAFYTRLVSQVGSFRWGSMGSPGLSSKQSQPFSPREQHPLDKDKTGKSCTNQHHSGWLSLDDSSQRGLTWVETDASRRQANGVESGYALETL
ncbi:hypothetical protein F4779DRAFT_564124 [Xylariaceae sp. FL0662B]|nr:hypothetical protein F4779DRAFT_564124 [Xylariaceae sp. FL0662B]